MKTLILGLALGLVSGAWAGPRKMRCGSKHIQPRPLAKLSAGSAAQPQVLKVVVLRVAFSDAAYTEDSSDIAAANVRVRQFFKVNSGGRLDMQLRILPGIIKSPKKESDYDQDEDYYAFGTYAEERLKAAGQVKGRDWDRYVVNFPSIDALDWAGLSAGLDGPDNWINGDYDVGVVAHELGHTVGLPHAASVEAGTSVLPADPDNGDYYEYGDLFDIMGDGDITCHFSTAFKEALGWLEPSEVKEVSEPGLYRIYAHDHENKAGLAALRVRSGVNNFEYWLEYRNTVGWSGNNAKKGAGVRAIGFVPEVPLLLDMSPSSQDNFGDFDDAGLEVNKEYKERLGVFTIRTVAVSSGTGTENDWVEVRVISNNVATLAKKPHIIEKGWAPFEWRGVRWNPLGRKL